LNLLILIIAYPLVLARATHLARGNRVFLLTWGINASNNNIFLSYYSHGNEIWDKMGYNSACVKDFCEIFAPVGGLQGWAIECCQLHFPTNDPRCHGNKIWHKIGYNSACVRDICEIFASIGGFSRMGHWMLPIKFYPDWLSLQWKRNLGQNGL